MWLTTWPTASDRPAYQEHPTEAAAEAHASNLVASGTTRVATVFEMEIAS